MQSIIKVVRKNIKNINLRITTNLEIILSVPLNLTDLQIQNVLINKSNWIRKHQLRIKSFKSNINRNENFQYLGQEYSIKVLRCNVRDVVLENDCVVVRLKCDDEENIKFKILEQWSYFTAKIYFKKLIDNYLPLVDKNVSKITIRKMKTRWGSCNTLKGYINLNIELLKKPIELIEYVILHEVTHLIHRNHDNNFYQFLSLHMPDWQIRKQKLNAII